MNKISVFNHLKVERKLNGLLILLMVFLPLLAPFSSGHDAAHATPSAQASASPLSGVTINPLAISGQDVHQLEEQKVPSSPVSAGDFGVWIHTTYRGISDSVKLDIGLEKFILMLRGGGWVPYTLTMEKPDDTTINLRFSLTKIFLDDGTAVDVMETRFTVDSQMDTVPAFNISLEVRFPFALLEKKTKEVKDIPSFSSPHSFLLGALHRLLDRFPFPPLQNLYLLLDTATTLNQGASHPSPDLQSYFSLRVGYSSPQGEEGPNRVDTLFFFGKNSIWDPQVFRMKISPSELDRRYSLTYFTSYLTVDASGIEAFFRVFSMEFDPVAELQITSIPRQAQIRYDFGSTGNGPTKISFVAQGGALSSIVQSFIINPLPAYMSFDLTILGERSFLYESDSSYAVTYRVDSLENNNLVTLTLHELPTRMTVEWDLNINLLAKTASGFVDLNMSHNIGYVSLSLQGDETPFLHIEDFPQALRVEGFIDVPHITGYVTASKYSGSPMTLTVPLSFGTWLLSSQLRITDGFLHLFWDLPTNNDTHVALGLDTNNKDMLGGALSLTDTTTTANVLSLSFGGIATDDLQLSWHYDEVGKVKDFEWRGAITKLLELSASVAYNDITLSISGSWTLGQSGSFTLEFSLPVEVTFVDITSNQFKLQGSLSLYRDRYLKIEWDLGQTGYFTIYTPEPIGESLYLELGYHYDPGHQAYQYGFKITATDFLVLSRTIMWDTQNGYVPRIWILGDNPLPGTWDVWLLWNYEWYEVV